MLPSTAADLAELIVVIARRQECAKIAAECYGKSPDSRLRQEQSDAIKTIESDCIDKLLPTLLTWQSFMDNPQERIREALEKIAIYNKADCEACPHWVAKNCENVCGLVAGLSAEVKLAFAALRAAQAAQVDKEKLEQRVKELEARVHELEFEPLSMHRQFQAKQGEVDLWEKRYNEAIKYIEGVRDYLEKQHQEEAMRIVFAQGLREMEENVSSAIALAIHLDHLITPKGESNGS